MPLRSEDWLDGATYHSPPHGGAGTPRVRLADLPPAQRRELAGFGLAAVTSCAFLLMPLVLAGAGDRELPATALAIRFAPAPHVPRSGAVAPQPRAARGRTPRARAVLARARHDGTPGTIGGPARSRPAATPYRRGTVRLVALSGAATLVASRRSLAGSGRSAVSRALLGDGRYRVQPFPLPAEEN